MFQTTRPINQWVFYRGNREFTFKILTNSPLRKKNDRNYSTKIVTESIIMINESHELSPNQAKQNDRDSHVMGA